MRLQITDFNGSDEVFGSSNSELWNELEEALTSVPLHLKASDQASKVGAPIWDAVGNNAAIKESLVDLGWSPNVPIPGEFAFLGTDIDFLKESALVEVQFSNYPFLLNNMLRCELFYKGQIRLGSGAIDSSVIVTKAKMFDASNSTLYYEQALNRLSALAENAVFEVPLRLVGLFEDYGDARDVVWTKYSAPRYSRTVESQVETTADIREGPRSASRAQIEVNL